MKRQINFIPLEEKGLPINCWLIHLDNNHIADEYKKLLIEDELKRMRAFRFRKDQISFINARGAIRVILGQKLSQPPDTLVFKYAQHGKPYLKGAPKIKFNLSHSGKYGLFAIHKTGKDIGIDIEEMKKLDDLENVARNFFSKSEVQQLLNAPKEQQAIAFYNCWTRKEAFIKAKGGGLSIPLDQFEVTLLPGETPRLVDVGWNPDEVINWELHSLNVPDYYKAAVVFRS